MLIKHALLTLLYLWLTPQRLYTFFPYITANIFHPTHLQKPVLNNSLIARVFPYLCWCWFCSWTNSLIFTKCSFQTPGQNSIKRFKYGYLYITFITPSNLLLFKINISKYLYYNWFVILCFLDNIIFPTIPNNVTPLLLLPDTIILTTIPTPPPPLDVEPPPENISLSTRTYILCRTPT